MQDRPIKPQKSPGKGLAALLFATSDSLTPTAVHVRRTLVRQTLAGLCLAALAFLLGRCTLLFGARHSVSRCSVPPRRGFCGFLQGCLSPR